MLKSPPDSPARPGLPAKNELIGIVQIVELKMYTAAARTMKLVSMAAFIRTAR